MKTAFIIRKTLLAAILVPMLASTGVVVATDASFAQFAGAPGGGSNNGGGRGRGESPGSGDSTSALDIDVTCPLGRCGEVDPPVIPPKPVPPEKPRKPRKPISVSSAPDCSCKLRKVKSGGQFIQIKDCYQIVRNTLRYCEPTAQ
jgi:hypothetical protein